MGSSPALQTPLHSRGPWAQAGDRWLWELPSHSSVPCSSLYQRRASGKSVSTSGLSWLLGKWGKDASQELPGGRSRCPCPKVGQSPGKLLLTSEGLLRVQRE